MSALVQGASGPWEVVIGMEIHAQVRSSAKLFSGAATDFGAEPNTNVSLIDAAMPGMLPVINGACVEQAVRTGLGLNARINFYSVFDRKNYFYPDLPPGYQISQYQNPIVGAGKVVLDMPDGTSREIGITRLHLEQDAGKSLHDRHPTRSYVDLNRAGVALMEIVSEPDLRSAEEAGLFLSKLRSILRYLGTCDGNMEEGSMRADVNVSVRRPGEDYGTRCEIKNLNSVRFVQQAIEYEARRQVDLIEEGGTVKQATRLFDSGRGVTREMRIKEEAHDYRYFPDPDLLPLVLDEAWVDEIRAGLPELPDAKKAKFIEKLGLTPYQASVVVADKDVADYYQEILNRRDVSDEVHSWLVDPLGQDGSIPTEVSATASSSANFLISDLFGQLNRHKIEISNSPVTAVDSATILDLRDKGVITARAAKEVLETMFTSGGEPEEIVRARGLAQVSDQAEIERIAAGVVAAHPEKVAEYKGGKEKLLGFFMGQVMKATEGRANPKLVNEALKRALED